MLFRSDALLTLAFSCLAGADLPATRIRRAVAELARAPDPNVDPIGACVGPRGQRVNTIVEELKGEKIDIIRWSEDVRVSA